MVRALDKADADADAFKRSIILGAIYHPFLPFRDYKVSMSVRQSVYLLTSVLPQKGFFRFERNLVCSFGTMSATLRYAV